MAFPGTYNFSYYRGDTFAFNVVPRKSDGTVLDNLDSYVAKFTISTSRGADGVSNQVVAYSNTTASEIQCAITPADSDSLTIANTYVYDIEIRNDIDDNGDPVLQSPYPNVFTVLTGTISVTDQVSGAA